MEDTKPKIPNCEQHKEPNMKKKGNDSNNEYFNKLSVDVITSIFVRCPVKALSILRCVSKPWNDLIISPSFIRSHEKQSMENVPKFLIVDTEFVKDKTVQLRFASVDMEGEEENNVELCTVTVPGRILNLRESLAWSGLVCISIDYRRIYLCNPAIQQVYELPICSRSTFTPYNIVLFGYLHSKKEYKVVRFFYKGPPCSYSGIQVALVKCEVLTLNEDGGISNTWTEIADQMPPYYPDDLGLLVNECMYWFVKPKLVPYSQCDRIVSFDFENDKFLTISRPSCFDTLSGVKMMDLKGLFCLPDTRGFRGSSILDLWVLKDKITCTWVKEHSINLVNCGFKSITPFCRTWNEEIIFSHLVDIVFYDLKGKRVTRVKKCSKHWLGIYWESLFSFRKQCT